MKLFGWINRAWVPVAALLMSPIRLLILAGVLSSLLFVSSDVVTREGSGPSALCHVTDGTFTVCSRDGTQEWSDITPTVFRDTGAVLYVDQADLVDNSLIPDFEEGAGREPVNFFTSDGLPDHLVFLYESPRRIPLGLNEYFLVHFNTVNSAQGILQHYAVRIYSDATIQVFIDGVDQGGRSAEIGTMRAAVGFGSSPTNLASHVTAELQVGLEAAGFIDLAVSSDPTFGSSTIPFKAEIENPTVTFTPGGPSGYDPGSIYGMKPAPFNFTPTPTPTPPPAPTEPLIPSGNLGLKSGGADAIDALSYGHGSVKEYAFGPNTPVNFSVRPGAVGLSGSDLQAEAACNPEEVAADEYGCHPNCGQNTQWFDEDGVQCTSNQGGNFGLLVGDDIAALDDLSGKQVDTNSDQKPDVPVFFSLTPGSQTLEDNGWSPADILVLKVGAATPVPYASQQDLGLQDDDDIDAIELLEDGDEVFEPELLQDFLIFSLKAGSPTLTDLGATPGDLLTFFDPNIGPVKIQGVEAANLGLDTNDDLDALKADVLTVKEFSQFAE